MSAIASQITGVTIVYSTVCSSADQRKHQISASLAFVRNCTFIITVPGICILVQSQVQLKVEEIDKAKVLVIHMVQRSHFSNDIAALSNSRKVPRSSRLSKLDVFIAESGLIRVGGRIRHSSLSDDIKHPVVLPSDHEISSQIIQYFHQRSHHQGRGITCFEVGFQGFWILSLQNRVKKLIRSCVTCSCLRGKPVEQKMADLPEDRLCPSFPFWFSGCDLFGLFLVKSGRREVKRLGFLFTCLPSRAVHIEVVHSLFTDSSINAFRRFVVLRGSIRDIRCDQGTNFVGARNELLKVGCDMVFNPLASSHRGGIWQRFIGSARRVIEKSTVCWSISLAPSCSKADQVAVWLRWVGSPPGSLLNVLYWIIEMCNYIALWLGEPCAWNDE